MHECSCLDERKNDILNDFGGKITKKQSSNRRNLSDDQYGIYFKPFLEQTLMITVHHCQSFVVKKISFLPVEKSTEQTKDRQCTLISKV